MINAGMAGVLFNEDIGTGGGRELGRLVIEQADAGVIFGVTDTELGAGLTGPVNAIELRGDGTTANALDIGSLATIGGNGIVFNGGAGGLLTIETGNDAVRINGAVTLESDLRIDTDVAAATDMEVGNVTFTNDSPVDS